MSRTPKSNEQGISRRDMLRIGAGLGIAGALLELTGCAPSPSTPAEVPHSSGSATSEAPSTAETIGQDTEIAHDQLNMMEQTVSWREMEMMDEEEFARLGVADRAAYGYTLVSGILPESQRTYNVAPISEDQTSFFYDEGSKTRSGNLILAARDIQLESVPGGDVTELQARKLALALDYNPLQGSAISPGMKKAMDQYGYASQVDAVQVTPSIAANETGWIEGKAIDGQKQWFKAIEITNSDGEDLTEQMVRVTVKLQDDNATEVFWYMRGVNSGRHDGDLTQEYAKKTIG